MTPKSICLAFEVHQPFRLRKDFFWTKQMFSPVPGSGDLFALYFEDGKNREIFEKVAVKCYCPTNELILTLLDTHPEFKATFSITGTFLEQCEHYSFGQEILEAFRQFAASGRIEFLDQTYYHSLVGLYEDETEFIEQVKLHRARMCELIGCEPTFFENTELLYNNRLAQLAEQLGYCGILAEGADWILNGRSPNYLYEPPGCTKLKLLLRNYQLTDDVGFRFSLRHWPEYPLTASKYAAWLDATPGQCITLFMDYETFGEHQWTDTGIFAFLEDLPRRILAYPMEFATPSEVVAKYPASGVLDVPNLQTTSWADVEKDTSCFLGNTMQWSCYEYIQWLEPYVKETNDAELLRIWRYLGISDHLYYMFTAGGAPGDVHSYFSHFARPYDAFITFFSVIHDFDTRVRAQLKEAREPFVLSDGREVRSVKGLCNLIAAMSRTEIAETVAKSLETGELERWLREAVGDVALAKEVRAVRAAAKREYYTPKELQNTLLKSLCRSFSTEHRG
jgi:alpha-amylase